MIERLSGILVEKDQDYAVVDVGGVGYQVFIPLSTFAALPALEQAVRLYTITYMREDILQLYGFASKEERSLFNLLNVVNGVGNKLALAALSTYSPADILSAIFHEDVTALARIPGVGKRIAQRMAMELRERVGKLPIPPEGGQGTSLHAMPSSAPGSLRGEIASALVNLGYKRVQVDTALREVYREEVTDFQGGLKAALKHLSP